MITDERLAELKAYCRVDHGDDDLLLSSLYFGAIAYLAGAGVERNESDALYNLTVNTLVLEWYDGEGIGSGVTVGIRKMIQQMKLGAAECGF